MTKTLILVLLLSIALCDVYLHNPQGSNNRACEKAGNRKNAQRLFDSENNGRGGYACQKSEGGKWGRMKFYGGSELVLEWTAQHGCGNPLVKCEIILQYMCGDHIRDGTTTQRITANTVNDQSYGYHETLDYFKKCAKRSRNLGLFTNDRFGKLVNKPKFEGTCAAYAEAETVKKGYPAKTYKETCKQYAERKTTEAKFPKKDYKQTCEAACKADKRPMRCETRCENNRERYDMRREKLLEKFGGQGWHGCEGIRERYKERRNKFLESFKDKCDRHRERAWERYIDRRMRNERNALHTRQNRNGQEHGFECSEERDYYPYWHPSPWKDIAILSDNVRECKKWAKESQNVKEKGECLLNGKPLAHNNKKSCEEGEPEDKTKGKWVVTKPHGLPEPECLRPAYSKSNHLGIVGRTGEMYRYKWKIPNIVAKKCILRIRYNITTGEVDRNMDYKFNKQFGKAPMTNNPKVKYFDEELKLNMDTNQFGRTFQDRSHSFEIAKAPVQGTIHNLNVRGKKGALVPNYPALEYDFVPNDLTIKQGHYVHIQWTGSDYNKGGKDRNNLVEITSADKNYPNYKLQDDIKDSMFSTKEELKKVVKPTLYNDAGLIKMQKTGTFHYMCTRNNDFSNRDQKGRIKVVPSGKPTSAVVEQMNELFDNVRSLMKEDL